MEQKKLLERNEKTLLLLLYYLLLPNVTIYIFYCFSNNYIILKYLIKGAKYNEKWHYQIKINVHNENKKFIVTKCHFFVQFHAPIQID